MSYKRWAFIATLLFVIGLTLGVAFGPSATGGLVSQDIAGLSELSRVLNSLPPLLIMVFIFAKNVSVLLFSFVLSPIFCLMPIMALFFNGLVIATLSAMIIEEESLGFVLAALLPHGVIEIPALILGEAAALSFGAVATLSLFRKESRGLVLPSLRQNLKYLVVAAVLLLPAAVIETYVTPLLLR